MTTTKKIIILAGLLSSLPQIVTVESLTITTFNVLAPVHRSMPTFRNTRSSTSSTGKHQKNMNNNNNNGPINRNNLLHNSSPPRESQKEEWWKPRAEQIASYIYNELSSSDIILLQEWWFHEPFERVFDQRLGDMYTRVAERRPSHDYLLHDKNVKYIREDGLAILVKKANCEGSKANKPDRYQMNTNIIKGGKLELCSSRSISTGPGRIGQIVTCRGIDCGREVRIANVHLSFPSSEDSNANAIKQREELRTVVEELSKVDNLAFENCNSHRLEIIGGDFNSDSKSLPSKLLEDSPYHFVSCASAISERCYSNGCNDGCSVNLGVTHKTHLGQHVSVDHLFVRTLDANDKIDRDSKDTKQDSQNDYHPIRSLGYLDSHGTTILDCQSGTISLDGSSTSVDNNTNNMNKYQKPISKNGQNLISDHKPVTARIDWPCTITVKQALSNCNTQGDHPDKDTKSIMMKPNIKVSNTSDPCEEKLNNLHSLSDDSHSSSLLLDGIFEFEDEEHEINIPLDPLEPPCYIGSAYIKESPNDYNRLLAFYNKTLGSSSSGFEN